MHLKEKKNTKMYEETFFKIDLVEYIYIYI